MSAPLLSSLVGMTMGARRRAIRSRSFVECLTWAEGREQYRLGWKLRPCIGCAVCEPCATCKRPSTCVGLYDPAHVGQKPEPACDECCGHGCEDGHCDKRADDEIRCDGSGVLPAHRNTGPLCACGWPVGGAGCSTCFCFACSACGRVGNWAEANDEGFGLCAPCWAKKHNESLEWPTIDKIAAHQALGGTWSVCTNDDVWGLGTFSADGELLTVGACGYRRQMCQGWRFFPVKGGAQ